MSNDATDAISSIVAAYNTKITKVAYGFLLSLSPPSLPLVLS